MFSKEETKMANNPISKKILGIIEKVGSNIKTEIVEEGRKAIVKFDVPKNNFKCTLCYLANSGCQPHFTIDAYRFSSTRNWGAQYEGDSDDEIIDIIETLGGFMLSADTEDLFVDTPNVLGYEISYTKAKAYYTVTLLDGTVVTISPEDDGTWSLFSEKVYDQRVSEDRIRELLSSLMNL